MALGALFPKLLISQICTVISSPRHRKSLRTAHRKDAWMTRFPDPERTGIHQVSSHMFPLISKKGISFLDFLGLTLRELMSFSLDQFPAFSEAEVITGRIREAKWCLSPHRDRDWGYRACVTDHLHKVTLSRHFSLTKVPS